MDIRSDRTVTEERLAREGSALTEVLEGLRGYISPVLIGTREWQQLLDRAGDLPASFAAYPFGFEFQVHERRPGADLGVSLVGDTGPAAFFEQNAKAEDADSYAGAIARLLSETHSSQSPLGRIVGRKMMLEFDVDAAPPSARPDLGIFLRPAEAPIVAGQGERGLEALGIVLDGLVSALGWQPDPAETRQCERIYRALEPGAKVESLGGFPSRQRVLRLAATGFTTTSSVVAFLERARWPGSLSLARESLARFEDRSAFVQVGTNMDVLADGCGPTLGLSILAKRREPNDPAYWVDRPDQWSAFLDVLREDGLAVPEKLAALADWTRGPAVLFGKSGPFVLIRGIHHAKLVLIGDRLDKIKVYVFMLLVGSMPPA